MAYFSSLSSLGGPSGVAGSTLFHQADIDFGALGYNTDYQNGYRPSMPADTSRDAYNNWRVANGKDQVDKWYQADVDRYEAWRDSMNNYYQAYYSSYNKAYDDWYNSPEQVIARSRAAGQNPYYTDAVGQPAVSAGSFSPDHNVGKSSLPEKNDTINTIGSAVNGLLNIAGMVNSFYNDQVSRDYRVQQTVGQAIENRKGYYLLGGDNGYLGFNSDYVGLTGKAAKAFNRITPDTPLVPTVTDPNKGKFVGNSPFAGQVDAQINNLAAMGNLKQYQLDNILPSISSLYRMQAAVNGLDSKDAKIFHDKIMPKVLNAIEGTYDFSDKAIAESFLKEFEGTKLEGLARMTIQLGMLLRGGRSFLPNLPNIF